MSRLLVTAVLVPALLLTQWIGAFRCAGCPMPGRESQPHVHLNGWLPTNENDCRCHRHHSAAKPDRDALLVEIAAFVETHEGDDFASQTEVVLVLPLNADWDLGNTADRSPSAEKSTAVEAPIFSSRAVHSNAMPVLRQFPSAMPPFPVELAAHSLRI